MKIFKKIVLGFVVVMTILGMVAFYFPIRNIPQQAAPVQSEDSQPASVIQTVPTSTISVSNISVSSTPNPDSKAIIKNMSGFSDLGQESDLINNIGSSASGNSADDILKELNK